MLVTPITFMAGLVAAVVLGTRASLRVRAIWRDPVFDDIAWRAARRHCWWGALTTAAVVFVDLFVGALPRVVEVGVLTLVTFEYLVARRFRADVYLQRRVAWEEQMRAHLAMPDAAKGE